MQLAKTNFLDHVKCLRHAVMAAGAEFILAGDSLAALVRKGQKHWVLQPQFLTTIDGASLYTPQLHEKTEQFAGWVRHRNKRWDLATDRLAFKRFAGAAGLPIPEFSFEAVASLRDVVAKRPVPSFGQHVKGPFRSASDYALDMAQGEYFESFIEGDLLKVWFWEGRPICAEQDSPPLVIGDGVTTVGELIERRADHSEPPSDDELAALLARCEVILRYYGATLATVIPKGVKQTVELRHGRDLMHPRHRRLLDFSSPLEGEWVGVLHKAGQQLLSGVPQDQRSGTLFTVDAVLQGTGKVWLLEMHSHPTVHPLVYSAMMDGILGPGLPVPETNQQATG